MPADRTADVLDATLRCLLRYGVRRTTMDDIAAEVGLSRSAVYQYVRNKDDAVRRLAARLHERALQHARAAAHADAPAADRVHDVLAAKLELTAGLFAESPHAAELLDEQARLSGDICRGFTADLTALLTGVLTDAGAPRPADTAQILFALTAGLLSTERTDLLRPATEIVLNGLGIPIASRHERIESPNLSRGSI
ncbi:TetR/AcrR family transcriptional regulator [Nocardia yunnanensis]|uniref:TetR/AcrR family transcriptional regulator n=1 Tax=Nocardia yunnanensis TaxID=2382165 RepID=A0A386ZES2_9NOCA|nr:TetR/AcrR family transcriptional regulator [Nocardia yunnanensis]AYF75693.1 TetR/AcrR family transcriptional regulator [Nocardia yunnanensis]